MASLLGAQVSSVSITTGYNQPSSILVPGVLHMSNRRTKLSGAELFNNTALS